MIYKTEDTFDVPHPEPPYPEQTLRSIGDWQMQKASIGMTVACELFERAVSCDDDVSLIRRKARWAVDVSKIFVEELDKQ